MGSTLGSTPASACGEERSMTSHAPNAPMTSNSLRGAPLHVGVAGCRGRMGRAVSQSLEQRSDALCALRFDRSDEDPDLGRCDVVIDFSTADASAALAARAAEAGRPALVIGSTGFDASQRAAI